MSSFITLIDDKVCHLSSEFRSIYSTLQSSITEYQKGWENTDKEFHTFLTKVLMVEGQGYLKYPSSSNHGVSKGLREQHTYLYIYIHVPILKKIIILININMYIIYRGICDHHTKRIIVKVY